jgi:hypothetical protein
MKATKVVTEETTNEIEQSQQPLTSPNPPIPETAKPKVTYPKEELLAIFDELLFSGEYVEEVMIKNKLRVKFRSRSVEDVTAISKEIDESKFVLAVTMFDARALLNLAYSLIEYNGKELSEKPEERKAFINKLPSVIVAALSDALSTLDMKVNMAVEEGDQNF